MKISFGSIEPKYNNNGIKRGISSANIMSLSKDTVSFTAMKKTRFSGIDLMMINKLKAPIEQFNSKEDFQRWCKDKVEKEYTDKTRLDELSESIDPQAQEQKRKILSDWIQYTTVENEAYTPAIQLMILSSITSDLSKDTNHLPPVLDKRILADTVYEIKKNCEEKKNYICNFNKLYRNKLQKGILKEESTLDPSLSGWTVIPSKTHDPKNFKENVKKLQVLSHDNWCTKTYNAEPYLEEGDFHIFMEKGKPKLGVRFNENDEFAEIQGEKNNGKIPISYLDIANAHVKENHFKLSIEAEKEFQTAEKIKAKIDEIKRKLSEQGVDIDTCSTKQLLNVFGIECEENEEGKLILESYYQPDEEYTFEDLGINENRLFKDIVEIEGNANFENSSVTDLGNLQSIGGDADFRYSEISDLGNLETIGGKAYFNDKITSLGKLKSINGQSIGNAKTPDDLL